MGGPKGCKAYRGTDRMAAATLTNMLMTLTRSWAGEDDAAKQSPCDLGWLQKDCEIKAAVGNVPSIHKRMYSFMFDIAVRETILETPFSFSDNIVRGICSTMEPRQTTKTRKWSDKD